MPPPSNTNPRPRLCYVMTDPVSTCFLRGQLAHFREQGYEVSLVTAPGAGLDDAGRSEGVAVHAVAMRREIHPWRDMIALVQLVRLFLHIRPSIVNAGTPKGGLLGMVAGWIARVPVRVYTLHGLRLETTHGAKRALLSLTERSASWCATRIVCVSNSLKESYLRLRLAPAEKISVLGCGSCNGIDTDRYRPPGTQDLRQADAVRQRFGIPAESPLLLAVGRLTRDKGLPELVQAFQQVRMAHPKAQLLLVGAFESGDPVSRECREHIESDPAIHLAGQVDDPRPYYWAADLLVHPSLREGFPYAPLEAAACGKAIVGCRVTGVRDAVLHGETGLLVPAQQASELTQAINTYLANPGLADQHGLAARRRVVNEYRQEQVWRLLSGLYRGALRLPVAKSSSPQARAA